MENRNTRSVKRKAKAQGEIMKGTIKKARAILESSGEVGRELELPREIFEGSMMADAMEAIKEMGQAMVENMNRQLEIARDREDANAERYRQLVEGQQRFHREDTEVLATQFERMRIEKEQARGRQTQRLPQFDGVNLDIDEWQEKTEAVAKCNDWDVTKLMENLPTTLTGQAKRSFDSLTDDDKRTKEEFFQSMRTKLDPQAEKKNKELFMLARRGPTESIMQYIDRLRMYIRRWGGDPKEAFAIEMLKYKTYDSLNPTDRKILNATVDHSEDLDKIILKADTMVTATPPGMIGAVWDNQHEVGQGGQSSSNGYGRGGYRGMQQGSIEGRRCYGCGKLGHHIRTCWQPNQQVNNQYGGRNQGENQMIRPGRNPEGQVGRPRQPLQDITQNDNFQRNIQINRPKFPSNGPPQPPMGDRLSQGPANIRQQPTVEPQLPLNSQAPLQ